MKQVDHDEYDVEDLGALIEEGLNEALAWRRGEITLPVHNVPPDYGKRIRAMRKRLGVKSRAAFAEAFGVPGKTLQNWEQGRTRRIRLHAPIFASSKPIQTLCAGPLARRELARENVDRLSSDTGSFQLPVARDGVKLSCFATTRVRRSASMSNLVRDQTQTSYPYVVRIIYAI